MAETLDIAMPPDLDIGAGYTLRATALDATTGNVVANVKVSTLVLTVDDLTGQGGANLEYGPFMLVPGPGA